MKKIILVLSIIILLSSCKSVTVDNNDEEIFIVNKALSIAKPEYIKMNILEKPDNTDIIRYKNGGFIDDNDNLYIDKFNFNNNRVNKWNNNIGLYNKLLKGKITLIDDYNKVEKVSISELDKSKTILSISNVMFSENGKLAMVNIGTLSNLIGGDYEGQIYVFKKEKNEWVFFFNFLSGIS